MYNSIRNKGTMYDSCESLKNRESVKNMENVNFDREELEYSAMHLYNNMLHEEARNCKHALFSTTIDRSILMYRSKTNCNVLSVDAESCRIHNAFCDWVKCCEIMRLSCGESIVDKFATSEDFVAYITKYAEDNYSKLTTA